MDGKKSVMDGALSRSWILWTGPCCWKPRLVIMGITWYGAFCTHRFLIHLLLLSMKERKRGSHGSSWKETHPHHHHTNRHRPHHSCFETYKTHTSYSSLTHHLTHLSAKLNAIFSFLFLFMPLYFHGAGA